MKKLCFLLLGILLIFNLSIEAQSINGQIIDGTTGQTIPGATVYIKGTNMGTITNLDGKFSLKVPEGLSKLQITAIGYIEYTMDLNIEGFIEQTIGKIELQSDAIGIEEVKVIASFAVDRKTPITVSTIDPVYLSERMGSQEFPEILKTTPSIYATKQGGGYGDGRVNLRGFDSRNVGVLINGVPVNDMETGHVYWSNWSGLSDVTRTIQVQRGIGASKLAISSVGGTINIITKTTDMEKGGNVSYNIGNDGYSKVAFTVSTGMYENGWAVTASGAHTTGDGYVKGTNFEGWSYYFNISKRFSDKNQISFNAFGAPQWHNQRSNKRLIEDYRNSPDGIKMNWDYGYLNNEIYPGAYAYNFYHKPVISLNHYFKINENIQLNTVLYNSNGRGGGRRVYGQSLNVVDGLIDYESAIATNEASLTGSKTIIAAGNNSHNWWGLLSTLKADINKMTLTTGIDARYYKGFHFYTIEDLLGGSYFLDSRNINRDPGTPLYKGDVVNYENYGEVLWEGFFAQVEYSSTNFSSFLSGSLSNTAYRRSDYFQYTPDEGQVTDWFNFLTYSVKAGANYNITDWLNVFANGGYNLRPPYMKFVYPLYNNVLNEDVQEEKVLTFEAGLGLKTAMVKSSIYGYYTNWMDKSMTFNSGTDIANVSGLDALHKGIEFVSTINPTRKVNLGLMFSIGDWQWNGDGDATITDLNGIVTASTHVYASGIHVSDAAQTTGAVIFDWELLPRFKVGADWTYFDRVYAQFNVEYRTDPADKGIDAWKMPSYNLLDCNVRYDFNIGDFNTTLYGKVDNLFDTEYISDAQDGGNHDAATALVYYGFGRTWNLGLKVRF